MTEIDPGLPESEVERLDLTGEVPDLICAECAKNAIVYTPLGVAATHCAHNATGAWRIHHEWTLIKPIDAGPFIMRLEAMLAIIKLELNQTRH